MFPLSGEPDGRLAGTGQLRSQDERVGAGDGLLQAGTAGGADENGLRDGLKTWV